MPADKAMMSKTIVLIDDDPDDLDIMKETLEKVAPATQCISFLYPDEAIRVITTELIVVPDYIIIDMNMPRKTGLECLRELRAQEEFNEIPIIIYSTTISGSLKETLMKEGATHVFQKPSKYEAWTNVLNKVMHRDWAFFYFIGWY
jgi:CheY-like chemotaxis protein